MRQGCIFCFFVVLGTLVEAVSALGQEPAAESGLREIETTLEDMYQLSAEELEWLRAEDLFEQVVVLASDSPERLRDAPAAMIVVSAYDIETRG